MAKTRGVVSVVNQFGRRIDSGSQGGRIIGSRFDSFSSSAFGSSDLPVLRPHGGSFSIKTIHRDPNSRVSSLVWCRSGSSGLLAAGRLFSSSIDGSVLEWDLFDLTQKIVVESIGVSIWQMAATPYSNTCGDKKQHPDYNENEHANGDSDDDDSSDNEDDDDSVKLCEEPVIENTRIAVACDDGCVRIYSIFDSDQLIYNKSLPRVSGRALSVTWSDDANKIYSGSSD